MPRSERPRQPDLYFVLGVPPDATTEEVHRAWKRQLRYWHPDRGNHPDAAEYAKLINHAHDVLADPGQRAAYDQGRQGWRPGDAVEPPRPGRREPTYRAVDYETRRPRSDGFDKHGLLSRLEALMHSGRLAIERPRDPSEIAKWEAQAPAVLRTQLGDHQYVKRFEEAIAEARPGNLVKAYGILWAIYEDVRNGELRVRASRL
jgi:curved DNA-binding protein CbpA